jgi:hypothetical protein
LCVYAVAYRAVRMASTLSALGLAAVSSEAVALNNDMVLLRATAGATYNSNVLGVSNELSPRQVGQLLGGRSEGAWILDYGAGVRCDLPVSRQRFQFDLSATRYDYSQYNELNYTGYAARGRWDWRVGNDWWGQINAGATQTRQIYQSGIAVNVPALVKTYDELADAHYALSPRWELSGSLSATQSRYASTGLQSGDVNVTDESVGVMFRTPLGNGTGLRLTFEQGEWPNLPPLGTPGAAGVVQVDNTYTQFTLALVLDWQLTGRSHLSGNIGYTARTQLSIGRSNVAEGPSGTLTYDYSLSGKSRLQASLYQTFGPLPDPTASYVKTTGLDLTYKYQASAKTTLQASITGQKIDYLGVPSAQQRKDNYGIVGFGATYQATRTLNFSAGAQYQNRNSNIPLAAYDVYTVYINANVEF